MAPGIHAALLALALSMCLQDGRTQRHVASARVLVQSGRAVSPHQRGESPPGQRGVHGSSSLKTVRLCSRMCPRRTCPLRSRVWRTCFRPCRPPWLSQNTGSTCSDLSSRFCRHPDWRTLTTDSGNLHESARRSEEKRKANVILEFPAGEAGRPELTPRGTLVPRAAPGCLVPGLAHR